MKRLFILLIICPFLLTACKKAKTNVEVDDWIVGQWLIQTGKAEFLIRGDSWMRMELTADNRVRSINWTGDKDEYGPLTTASVASAEDHHFTFDDSMFFYADTATFRIFNTAAENPQPNMYLGLTFLEDYDLHRLTEKKLVLKQGEEKFVFKKDE